MSFTALLIQTARLERHGAPAPDAFTGESLPAAWQTVSSGIPCRVSWGTGSEAVGPRNDQRGQYRFARIFIDPGSWDIKRGDRLVVAQIPGHAFEVTFQKLVYDGVAPHHWEIDTEVVEGT